MPAPTPLDHAQAFLRHLDTAQTEAPRKEHFITYLNQVFGTDEENRKLIREFTGGAEHQLRILRPERGGSAAGRADTQYRDVIIEFERDIRPRPSCATPKSSSRTTSRPTTMPGGATTFACSPLTACVLLPKFVLCL